MTLNQNWETLKELNVHILVVKNYSMICHLNEFHQVEANKQVINFENENLFMDWKEKEELKNFVYYLKQREDGESKLLIHKYFICQHDGDGRPHRKDGDPARKSN